MGTTVSASKTVSQNSETASKTFLLICKGVEIRLDEVFGSHFNTVSEYKRKHIRRIMVEDMLNKCIQAELSNYLSNQTTCSPNWGRHKNDKQPS